LGRLIDLSVRAFEEEVASDLPAPGGGSAAALAGGVAAALVAMVCRLSLGRDDVEASDEELSNALERAEHLRRRLLELVDEDTAAFESFMAALRMPKENDVERASRASAIADAQLAAAAPPLETLAAAREVLDLVGVLVGRTNTNVVSDLGVAAHLALAAAEGAMLNVAVNVSSLPAGDDVSRYRSESGAEIEAVRVSAARSAAAVAAALGVD
jgi:formiminotetrahydrofolate cyclodeaminase